MIRPEDDETSIILTDEEYFEQLDLLFKIYELQIFKEKLKKRLKRLSKEIKREKDNNYTIRFDAIKNLMLDYNQKIKKYSTDLYDEFNFFRLKQQISKIKYHQRELKKAYSDKRIDEEAFTITNEYYLRNLEIPNSYIDKLKILSQAYLGNLYNQSIVLELKLKNLKSERRLKEIEFKSSKEIKKDLKKEISSLFRKQKFFQKQIIQEDYELKHFILK